MISGSDQIVSGDQRRGANLLWRNLGELLLKELIRAEIAMAGQAVGAVQRQMFIEAGQAEEFFQSRLFHARDMTKAHVIVDQGKHLGCVVIGEPQALTDFLRNLDAHLDVPIETDAIGRHAKGRRLTHIVQQRAPRQRGRARMGQVFQQQQRMHKHIAFRMELRRLLNAFHRRNLGQDFFEQTGLIEQEKSAPGMAFGEHLGEFIANALARDHMNFGSQALDRGQRLALR